MREQEGQIEKIGDRWVLKPWDGGKWQDLIVCFKPDCQKPILEDVQAVSPVSRLGIVFYHKSCLPDCK